MPRNDFIELRALLDKDIVENQLSKKEADLVRTALADPEVQKAFVLFISTADKYDKKLHKKAYNKIKAISSQNNLYGEMLFTLQLNMTARHRLDEYNKFIVDHSKNEIIKIIQDTKKFFQDAQKSSADENESLFTFFKAFNCSWTEVEKEVLAVYILLVKGYRQFVHNWSDAALDLKLKLGPELQKKLFEFVKFLKNHKQDKLFQQNVAVLYAKNKDQTIHTLGMGLILPNHRQTTDFFKKNSFL